MHDVQKFAAMYEFSTFELEASPLQPSELFRQREARMAGRMAEEAHLAGYRFVDWPAFELKTNPYGDFTRYHGVLLRGEVKARKTNA